MTMTNIDWAHTIAMVTLAAVFLGALELWAQDIQDLLDNNDNDKDEDN